jgi:hypothetical protein
MDAEVNRDTSAPENHRRSLSAVTYLVSRPRRPPSLRHQDPPAPIQPLVDAHDDDAPASAASAIDAVPPFLSCFHLSLWVSWRVVQVAVVAVVFDCKWLACISRNVETDRLVLLSFSAPLFFVQWVFLIQGGERGCVHLDSSTGWLLGLFNQPGSPALITSLHRKRKSKSISSHYHVQVRCTQ